MTDFTKEHMQAHVDANASRDTIIIDMVSTHGYTLNKATKRFAELAKELGIQTGRGSRKAEALALIGELDGTADAEGLSNTCKDVADELGITAQTVQGYVKEVYEKNGWHFPVVGSASEAILNWLVKNHECSKEEFTKFMSTAGEDGTARSSSNTNEYWKGMILHRRIMAKLAD
jgi:hypothetical protein